MKKPREYAEEAASIATLYSGNAEAMLEALEGLFRSACERPRRISQVTHTSDVVMVFKTNGTPETWGLESDLLKMWKAAFPGLDVEAECVKAGVWMESNPTRRKTARGMGKFLYSWLARANDKAFMATPVQRDNRAPKGAHSWSEYRRKMAQGEQG